MKIFCIGRNYVEHAKELNNDIPKQPLVFMKPATALLNGNKDFYLPDFSNELHYEVELVIKICKNGKYIEPQFASTYYNEFSLGLDLTARDLQSDLKKKGHPWEIAKAFDNSAVIGKFVSTTDFPVKDLSFSLTKNGKTIQSGNTQQMIFSIDQIITHISQYFRLQMGDLIYTGTPSGVGKMEIGDRYEGFVGEKKAFHTNIK